MKRKALWNTPKLWLPWLAATFANLFSVGKDTENKGWNNLMSSAIQYWKDLDNNLTADVVRELLHESNRHQDARLTGLIDQLHASGSSQYAISIGKFLLLKQQIEQQLHAEGELTERKQNIERLVDSLCSEVCQQIQRLALLDGRLAEVLTSREPESLERLSELRVAGHRRVLEAYGSLYDTAQNLYMLVRPGRERPDQSEDDLVVLDRLISVLREEHELSKKVHERIRQELPQTNDPGEPH